MVNQVLVSQIRLVVFRVLPGFRKGQRPAGSFTSPGKDVRVQLRSLRRDMIAELVQVAPDIDRIGAAENVASIGRKTVCVGRMGEGINEAPFPRFAQKRGLLFLNPCVTDAAQIMTAATEPAVTD